MSEHEYMPLRVPPGVVAACLCGWTSMYTHAFDKYARPDHEFHVEQEAVPCGG